MSLAALCARRGAALAASRVPAAQLATGTAAVLGKASKQDEYVFKEHCRGQRKTSPDSEALREQLRKTNFGAPRKSRPPAAEAATAARPGGPHTAVDTAATQQRALHWAAAARLAETAGGGGSGGASEPSVEEASQELVEKGAKRMMQSDDGREELRQGSFDLDATTERMAEEGAKDASPEAAARAQDSEVKEAVKRRVMSGSQTS